MPGVRVSERGEGGGEAREGMGAGTLGSRGGLGILFLENQGALGRLFKGGGHQTSTLIYRGGVGSNPSKFRINQTQSLTLF